MMKTMFTVKFYFKYLIGHEMFKDYVKEYHNKIKTHMAYSYAYELSWWTYVFLILLLVHDYLTLVSLILFINVVNIWKQ